MLEPAEPNINTGCGKGIPVVNRTTTLENLTHNIGHHADRISNITKARQMLLEDPDFAAKLEKFKELQGFW